jgi:hypothetical protein
MVCATCEQETCEDEAQCILFWRLDLFWFLDFGSDDDEPDPYEEFEERHEYR